MPIAPQQKGYRWVILGLLWLLYAAFGLISRSISALVTPILNDLGISYTQMGFILGSWQLAYIPAALAAGWALDKWGSRRCLLFGAIVIGLSSGLRFFATGFYSMLLCVSLFGVGGPMMSIGGPKTISELFSGRSRGTAIGIYMVGPGLGGLLALALTNSLIMPLTGNSWRLTFAGYGLLALAFGLLWWFYSEAADSASSTGDLGFFRLFVRLITVRNVQVLLVMALLSFAIGHGFSSWLPKILETGGLSAAMAGYAASIPLAASIPAVILIPRFAPPRVRGRLIAILALLTMINLYLVVTASGTILVAGLVLFGLTSSCFMPLMILIMMDSPEVETEYMGSAGGMFFCVAEIGGFTGPLIMGVLVDASGAFLSGAVFLSIVCLALAGLTFLFRTSTGIKPGISGKGV